MKYVLMYPKLNFSSNVVTICTNLQENSIILSFFKISDELSKKMIYNGFNINWIYFYEFSQLYDNVTFWFLASQRKYCRYICVRSSHFLYMWTIIIFRSKYDKFFNGKMCPCIFISIWKQKKDDRIGYYKYNNM